jgi:hypothetical protein
LGHGLSRIEPIALAVVSAPADICPVTIENLDWTTVYHTAVYVGGGRIVEATGTQVQLNTLGQWGSGDLMPNGRRP